MLFKFDKLRAPLCSLIASAEDDGDDGGGGGGAPEGLTKAQQDQVQRMLNGALASSRKHTESLITSALDGFGSKLDDRLSALVQPKGGEDDGKDGKAPDLEKHLAPYKKALQEREAELDAKLKELNDQTAKRRAAEEESALHAALVRAGVRAEAVGPVVDHFFRKGLVERTDDDQIAYKTGDVLNPHVALEDGVAGWIKQESNRWALPARDVAGSGNTGGRPNAGGGQGGDGPTEVDLGNFLLGGQKT